MSDTPSVRALRAIFDQSKGDNNSAAANSQKDHAKPTEETASDAHAPVQVTEPTRKEMLKELSLKKKPKEVPTKAPQEQSDSSDDHTAATQSNEQVDTGERSAERAEPHSGVILTEQPAPREPYQEALMRQSPEEPTGSDTAELSSSNAHKSEKDDDSCAPAAAPMVPPRPAQKPIPNKKPASGRPALDDIGYSKCFDAINVDGIVWPSTTRVIWRRSGIPDADLADIWNQVASDDTRGLTHEQFTKGMRLIDARLRVQTSAETRYHHHGAVRHIRDPLARHTANILVLVPADRIVQTAACARPQQWPSAHGGSAQPLQAGGQSWRFATAGGDNNVRMWMVHPNVPSPAAIAAATGTSRPNPPRTEYLCTLARHTGVVNVVRFSPNGEVLASAGDDGMVLFWVKSNRAFERDLAADIDERYEKEVWKVKMVTRATSQELYDLSWSPDGVYLAAGGTDFRVHIIDTRKGAVVREISDHQHYVQGLAWDPLGQMLATESSDRSMHIYENGALRAASGKLSADGGEFDAHSTTVPVSGDPAIQATHASAPPPIAHGSILRINAPAQRLYGDDRYSGFFRRLGWSPDGSLLAAPSGQFNAGKLTGSIYIYGRASLSSATPLAVLPGHKCVTLVVRFSPILYELRGGARAFSLPYRMVYAVATQESVWVYDTQQSSPLYCFSNLHYASMTDLAWSADGQTLMMSSTDGYCSVAVFDYNELGVPIPLIEQPCLKTMIPAADTVSSDPNVAESVPCVPESAPNFPPASSGGSENTDKPADTGAQPKKRRIALTYEGPLTT